MNNKVIKFNFVKCIVDYDVRNEIFFVFICNLFIME